MLLLSRMDEQMPELCAIAFTREELETNLAVVNQALDRLGEAGHERARAFTVLEVICRKLVNEQLGRDVAKHQQLGVSNVG